MLIAGYYIKPLYLILTVAILLILFIIKLTIKVLVKIILIIVVVIAVIIANKHFSTDKIKGIASSFLGNDKIGYDKIKELYDEGQLIPDIDDLKIKIGDIWAGVENIKDTLIEKNGKKYITIDGQEIEVNSDTIIDILKGNK